LKAIKIQAPGGIDRLQLVDVPDPGAPRQGTLRVRILGATLNFHDYLVVTGKLPSADGRIPLADGAGIVEAVGEGVFGFQQGDHVVSTFLPIWRDVMPPTEISEHVPGDGLDGYACEVVIADPTFFTKAPAGWSHVQAATLPTAGVTAWRALVVEGGLKAGDWILALGTGGVSIFALQLARLMGARVAITSSSDQKLKAARRMGATLTVNYRNDPDWGRTIAEATGGVDHVIEVGGPATLSQSIAAVRPGGRISLIGVLTGLQGEVPTAALMTKQIVLKGIVVGQPAHQQELVRALDGNEMRPVIDRVFRLEELPDAFRYLEKGAHFGKIAIDLAR
jgi:NADPH:quinone reductase-like Zn-dependent oxidoreductase